MFVNLNIGPQPLHLLDPFEIGFLDDGGDGLIRPSPLARGTGNTQGFQFFLDPHDAPALFLPAEDTSHDFCFLLIDDKILSPVTVIPEAGFGEGGGVRIGNTFSDAPSYAAALVLALSLGKGCMERQDEFAGFVGKEDPLILEVDVHPEFLQPPEHHKEIDAVAAETADGLGEDEINLSLLAIGHQAPESGTGVDASSGAYVGIGVDMFPHRMIQDVLSLEIHLGRQAVDLPFHFGADPAVPGNPPIPEGIGRQFASGDGSNRGFLFFIIRHDWSCIAWIMGNG